MWLKTVKVIKVDSYNNFDGLKKRASQTFSVFFLLIT